ncbi:MAG: phosphotransferase family protein [Acidimicrobiia bacterium]
MVDVELPANVLQSRLAPRRVERLRRLEGGASSLTYRGETPDGPVVVKVAPAGLEPVRNRDVLRQARAMRALRAAGVPVPQVLLEDAGAPPAEPPLFVMDLVPGTSVEPLFDPEGDDVPAVVAERMRDAARVMAALHSHDPAALGLGDEPVTSLADEVGRWVRLLDTVDPELAPGWREVADRLVATLPAPWPAAVVHGDFRLGNLLAEGPRITAIIDWEIWSCTDPRVDAGWFLINADPNTYRRATTYAGLLPSPDELAEIYADALGRAFTDRAWFESLACFKSTATWSLIVKHNRRREEPDPVAEEIAPLLPALVQQAASRLRPHID